MAALAKRGSKGRAKIAIIRITPALPYTYRAGNTILHRMAPVLKLLMLLGVSSAPFLFGPPAIGLCAGAIILGSILAGIRPWELLRGARPFGTLILIIIIYRSVDFQNLDFNRAGFLEALALGGNILVSFSAGALLFSVTTMTELKDSLTPLEKVLVRPLLGLIKKTPGTWKDTVIPILEKPRLGLGISLMLGFLPRFFELWETTQCAYQARGGKRGIPALLIIVPLVTEGMIEAAAETATAMEARGLP